MFSIETESRKKLCAMTRFTRVIRGLIHIVCAIMTAAGKLLCGALCLAVVKVIAESSITAHVSLATTRSARRTRHSPWNFDFGIPSEDAGVSSKPFLDLTQRSNMYQLDPIENARDVDGAPYVLLGAVLLFITTLIYGLVVYKNN